MFLKRVHDSDIVEVSSLAKHLDKLTALNPVSLLFIIPYVTE